MEPVFPLQNKYAEGLDHALPGSQQRATLYANRAACFMEMRHWQNAARDCTEAINIDGGYLKAWHRRCKAYEALGDHERALKDAMKVWRTTKLGVLADCAAAVQGLLTCQTALPGRITQLLTAEHMFCFP